MTTALIDPLIQASLVSMDDYLPGIEAVMAGEQTPSQAIETTMQRIEDEDDDAEETTKLNSEEEKFLDAFVKGLKIPHDKA